ncbi:AAA family ATPase [Fibrella aquatilis]|uniref:AAA family ATPase n=1 Tax=Fibrella aquatilis TaxID=2817059 RepID=A0A939GCR3_9BACT|nr:ATP-binding protein [Fibrella aquatilis]MBO0934187.1 AAA family ATPase [Fibrella aquatilis]
MLIGRDIERAQLRELLASPNAELLALYGRRRVGKTYLIRSFFANQLVFELSGLQDAPLTQQLDNFAFWLSRSFAEGIILPRPPSWTAAFQLLIQYLEANPKKEKQVLFLDELPWLDTPKSGFLGAFDLFWNSWASRQTNLIVVICGSAASWMIQHVVNNKGGLHNRITRRIRLLPFTLAETESFLKSQRVLLDRYQLLQLYMVMGGIPHYLKEVRPGESATQTIDRLCFTKDGLLQDEFKNLYAALFNRADRHVALIKLLANKPQGLTRNELIASGSFQSGGTVTQLLSELFESGFIAHYLPFGKTSKDAIYKLTDEYSLFYLKFIDNSRANGPGTWLSKSMGQSWTSWAGLAFEQIGQKHMPQLKQALGIANVYTEHSAWRYTPKNAGETGVQIDLLIDRQDHVINLCELKFSTNEFVITKAYAETLERKRRVFQQQTHTRKTIFLTLITTFGVKPNPYATSLIQSQLTMDALFAVK